jgi:TonB family protein
VEPRRKRIFWWVFGTHASVIFLLLVIPFLRGCFHRKPKEVVMEIGIAAPAPPAAVRPILPSIQPEPAPEPEPTPEPEKPAPVPEPEKPKPKPEPKPEKPKWEPAEVKPQFDRRVIRKAPTTPRPAVQPRRNLSELKKTLGSVLSQDPDDAYYGTIQPRFYAVWQQPASAPYGTRATATVRISSTGQATYSALTAPSGNPVFDQSVLAALRAIGRLPAPPKSLANRDITVDFIIN